MGVRINQLIELHSVDEEHYRVGSGFEWVFCNPGG